PERHAAGHHRPHDGRRPLHHLHAASRALLPQRADVLRAAGAGRGLALDRAVPQRPPLAGLMRALLFCTSYFESPEQFDARYRKWLEYHLAVPLAAEKLFLIDDGS